MKEIKQKKFKIDKKVLTYAAIILCALAIILTAVLLITRTRYRYELNDAKDGYIISEYNGWAKNIKIPAKHRGLPVVSIGNHAFADSDKLRTVTLPAGIKTLEYGAFFGCDRLETVNFNQGLEQIGTDAFGECVKITAITLPEGVKTVRSAAFNGCKGLKSVSLPKTIESITYLAFMGCTELNEITVADGAEHFYSKDNCLIKKDGEVLVIGTNKSVIPEGVESIAEGAFRDKIRLVSIVVPESVKHIGDSAFYGCTALRSVQLPGAKEIGTAAFHGCRLLNTLVVSGKLERVNEGAFSSCAALDNIYTLGIAAEFNAVAIYDGNNDFRSAALHIFSETEPTGEGSYWHYDSKGNPVIWQ